MHPGLEENMNAFEAFSWPIEMRLGTQSRSSYEATMKQNLP